MIQEFKDFILKGNVLDLAVGLVMGAAFGAVIGSFVADILMPPIGALLGADFTSLFYVIGDGTFDSLQAARDAGAPVIAWGNFVQNLINFVIIGFVLFLIVRQYNKMTKAAEEVVEPTAQENLLTEIRDLLANGK